MKVSAALWDQLVAAFEKAECRTDAANAAYSAAVATPVDQDEKSPEEAEWDAAFDAESQEEDRLLGVEAPHAEGAALQLRLFARRHHDVDLRKPQEKPEDREAGVLRRIYATLIS